MSSKRLFGVVLLATCMFLSAFAQSTQVFVEDFNGPSLDPLKWSISQFGSGATLSQQVDELVVALPGGSDGSMGVGDIFSATVTGISLAGDFEVYLKAREVLRQANGYPDFTVIGLRLSQYIGVYIAGNYAGATVGGYGSYFGHRIQANFDNSPNYCVFDESLSTGANYAFEFRVRRVSEQIFIGYRILGREWIETPCGSFNGIATPSLQVWSLDGAGTRVNAAITAAFDHFSISTSPRPSVVPDRATLNVPTIFTVTGAALPATLGFVLNDCSPNHAEVFDASTSLQLRKFRCTPRGSPGTRVGRLLNGYGNELVGDFRVSFVESSEPTTAKSLRFSAIETQVSGVSFPVTIEAIDDASLRATDYNGMVNLADGTGKKLEPSRIVLSNGVWAGTVKALDKGLYQVFGNAYTSDARHISGGSQLFSVGSSLPEVQRITVTGRISVAGPAIVKLRDTAGLVADVFGVVNASDGTFRFDSVAPGRYELIAQLNGYAQIRDNHIRNIDKTVNIGTVQMKRNGAKVVVLVPGIMGSTVKNDAYPYQGITGTQISILPFLPQFPSPSLPKERLCDLATAATRELEIYDPFVGYDSGVYLKYKTVDGYASGWPTLVTELTRRGYEVYELPYDWRCTIEEIVQAFVKPRLTALLAQTEGASVDVIAHSMGGLVMREYIQSAEYPGGIDRLIMLGTPNVGAAKAYFLTEGGDPKRADVAKGRNVPVYESAVKELVRIWADGRVDGSSILRNQTSTRHFIRSNIKSGLALLPRFDFFRQSIWSSVASRCIPSAVLGNPLTGEYSNQFLGRVNADLNRSRLISVTGVPADSRQVKTHLFLSAQEDTTSEIISCFNGEPGGAYELGIPGEEKYDAGDGTVRQSLSGGGEFLDQNITVTRSGVFGSHAALPGKLATRVAEQLTGIPNALNARSSSNGIDATKNNVAFMGTLEFQALLPSSTVVTTPSGSQFGVFADGDVSSNEEVSTNATGVVQQVTFKTALPGRYGVQVRVPSDQVRTLVEVRARAHSQEKSVGSAVRLLIASRNASVSFDVTNGALTTLHAVPLVVAPTALRARRVGTFSRLEWTASNSGAVREYRVFARPSGRVVFEQVGRTAENSFDTDVPWASSDEDETTFVVLAVNAAGEESFVEDDTIATNRSYVAAELTASASSSINEPLPFPTTLTFIDKSSSSSTITEWAWDFNGDGIVDSRLQHPTYQFNTPGRHTVSLRVTSADGSDMRVDTTTVDLKPCAPIIQSATCSLDANGDGVVDETDGLLVLRRILGFEAAATANGLTSASCVASGQHLSIAQFIDGQVNAGHYNIDGAPGGANATSSGLIILRALRGSADEAVTAGAIRLGATRTTWTGANQIQDYLAACGFGN